MRPLLVPALALASLRCGADDPGNSGFQSPEHTTGGPSSFGDSTTGTPTTTDATTSTSTSTTGDPSTTTATTAAPTTSDPTTTSATTEAPPVCGDGTLDDGEQCDDGNTDDTDACRADCTIGHALLVLAGRGDSPAAIATYQPDTGWSITEATYDFTAAELVATQSGALAVVRRAGAMPNAKDELWFTTWTAADPSQLNSATAVGNFGFTLDAPAIASIADTVTLAFLGTDNKHYTALHSNDAWSAFTPLPASSLDIQAFGPSSATLVAGADDLHAIYAGDDDRVYIAHKPAPDAAWEPSVQAPPPSVIDTFRPAAIVEPGGDLILAYVRKSDSQIGLTRRSIDDNTWTLEALVDPQALTSATPSLIRTDDGRYVLAWHGFNTGGIHVSIGLAHDDWDPPIAVENPATSSPPRLVPGAPGADAELFYTTGGKLKHVRIAGDEATAPEAIADATGTVAAARVQRAP